MRLATWHRAGRPPTSLFCASLAAGLLLFAGLATAQIQERRFETVVSDMVTAPLTEAVVQVSRTGPLDAALQKLEPLGIGREHLAGGSRSFDFGQSSVLSQGPRESWQFELTVPADRAAVLQKALTPQQVGGLPVFVDISNGFSISHQPKPSDLAKAWQARLPELFERGLKRIRAMAAAAGSEPGQVTRVELSGYGTTVEMRMISERGSPFAHRVIQVGAQTPVRSDLEEVRITLAINTDPDVDRSEVLAKVAQAGIGPGDLQAVEAGPSTRPNIHSRPCEAPPQRSSSSSRSGDGASSGCVSGGGFSFR